MFEKLKFNVTLGIFPYRTPSFLHLLPFYSKLIFDKLQLVRHKTDNFNEINYQIYQSQIFD